MEKLEGMEKRQERMEMAIEKVYSVLTSTSVGSADDGVQQEDDDHIVSMNTPIGNQPFNYFIVVQWNRPP